MNDYTREEDVIFFKLIVGRINAQMIDVFIIYMISGIFVAVTFLFSDIIEGSILWQHGQEHDQRSEWV